MLEGEEMALNLKKIVKHERILMRKKQEYEDRVRLERVNYKEEFPNAFKKIREEDKRVPLIICTRQ